METAFLHGASDVHLAQSRQHRQQVLDVDLKRGLDYSGARSARKATIDGRFSGIFAGGIEAT
jgi:hypothetical protein